MKHINRFGMIPQSWWGDTVAELPKELFSVLNDLTGPIRNSARWYELPRMVISENSDGIEVRASLPGFDPESVDAEVVGDFLTVRGEKKAVELGENERFIHREREADRLEETIKLPCRVDARNIKARYVDGVLTITLPRERPEEPKNIKVAIER